MSVELLQRATEYAREVISGLTSGDLGLATPCGDWDAGRVVLHLADVVDGLVGLVETGDLAMPEPPRTHDTDPVSTLHAAMNELAATMSTTSEVERADAAARAGAIEFTMHGWDIAIARDSDHEIPDDLANDVWELASSLITDDARGSIFAQPIDIAADASPSDRLAAFLGRQRRRLPA